MPNAALRTTRKKEFPERGYEAIHRITSDLLRSVMEALQILEHRDPFRGVFVGAHQSLRIAQFGIGSAPLIGQPLQSGKLLAVSQSVKQLIVSRESPALGRWLP